MSDSIAVTAIHWSQKLRAENTVLREALDSALHELRLIPQSRLDKARKYPDPDPCCDQAYYTCAQEVDRLSLAAIDRIRDTMAEKGVL
jgi:hypothetical protein